MFAIALLGCVEFLPFDLYLYDCRCGPVEIPSSLNLCPNWLRRRLNMVDGLFSAFVGLLNGAKHFTLFSFKLTRIPRTAGIGA